eukprot:GILK01007668.1.p1 GENE.GILK01007668.1~~GILK01007668.1.p1  ORF type:complete len:482 (+),score=55.90 GILK01007668.1:154-1599(+)
MPSVRPSLCIPSSCVKYDSSTVVSSPDVHTSRLCSFLLKEHARNLFKLSSIIEESVDSGIRRPTLSLAYVRDYVRTFAETLTGQIQVLLQPDDIEFAPEGDNLFQTVGDDATLLLLSFLNAVELSQVSAVSTRMAAFAKTPTLWKDLTISVCLVSPYHAPTEGWQSLYQTIAIEDRPWMPFLSADDCLNTAEAIKHKNLIRAEAVLARGRRQFPGDDRLVVDHALLLAQFPECIQDIEKVFQALLKKNPSDPYVIWQYGRFKENIRKDLDAAEALYGQVLRLDPYDVFNLIQFARFNLLVRGRTDPSHVEVYLEEAYRLEPESGLVLFNYALYYTKREEFDRAEQWYRKALASDPENWCYLANLAQLLLARRDDTEGMKILDAITSFLDPTRQHYGLAVECWFYTYAHGSVAGRSKALSRLKAHLLMGELSPGWDFSLNVNAAVSNRHPASEWLSVLAAVVNGNLPLTHLDSWPEWQQASD